MADGKVYVCTKKNLITLDAGKEKKVISEITLGSTTYATPFVAKGTLFVCSQSYLWAVPKGAKFTQGAAAPSK